MVAPITSPTTAALGAPGGIQSTDPNAQARVANVQAEQKDSQSTQTRNAVPPPPPSGSGRGVQLDIEV